jgi:hypothetical protein
MEHLFLELMKKQHKTPTEKLAIMAVIIAMTDPAYQKMTSEQTWDRLIADHDRVFEKKKPGE